ncbi:MAG TPA: IPT/TIG domain-containing protein [Polyangia bacterium]|nr:IPT/TIG domain-containing protein [Polyangia bacterium]
MKRQLFLALGVLWLGLAACTQNAGPLKVDSLQPPQGTTAGGEEITILGGGFQPGRTQAEVKFGRKRAEIVTIASNAKIKVVTPSSEKGPVDVTVMFDDGNSFKIANGFRYVEPTSGDNARRAFFSGSKPGASGTGKIEVEKASP